MPAASPTARSIPLNQIRVATPCPARWEDMQGDDARRFCGDCKLHVHDLSAMTETQAQEFLASRLGTGRTCVRFFQRADGRILTKDCPAGLRALRLKLARKLTRVASALAFVLGGAVVIAGEKAGRGPRVSNLAPMSWLREWINPAPAVIRTPLMGKMMMGDMCVAPPPPVAPAPAPTNSTPNAEGN